MSTAVRVANSGVTDGDAGRQLYLTELYRIIKRLMDATLATEDQDLKVLPVGLEDEARLCMQRIEGRLGVRN